MSGVRLPFSLFTSLFLRIVAIAVIIRFIIEYNFFIFDIFHIIFEIKFFTETNFFVFFVYLLTNKRPLFKMIFFNKQNETLSASKNKKLDVRDNNRKLVNRINIDYVNIRIDKEVCSDTINLLKDTSLIDKYK